MTNAPFRSAVSLGAAVLLCGSCGAASLAANVSQALSAVQSACVEPKLDFKTLTRAERVFAPGATLVTMRVPETPCEIRLARFDLKKNPKLKLRFAYGVTAKGGRTVPAELAASCATATEKPLAAINGDFFLFENAKEKKPARAFGLTVIGGKLIERGCWGPSGYDVIARLADGSYAIGKVTATEGKDGSFAAFCDGKPVTDAIRVWNRPLLHGVPQTPEQMNTYPKDDRRNYPRTLVGLGDGLVVFMVLDARQAGWSLGMPSIQAVEIMKREGCVEVGQFDGGGSTALWCDGKYVNRPSDGKPRPVANGLVMTLKVGSDA